MRAAWLVVFLAVGCLAQTTDFKKSPDRPLNGKPVAVRQCEAKVKEWQDWYEKSLPIHEQLQRDYALLSDRYDQMKARNDELVRQSQSNAGWVFFGFAGIGLGLGVAIMGIRFFGRKWRASPTGKQLAVLALGGVWVSVAALVSASTPRLSVHPVNLAFTVGVYSLPAILFSGIAFWWFEKTKQEAR